MCVARTRVLSRVFAFNPRAPRRRVAMPAFVLLSCSWQAARQGGQQWLIRALRSANWEPLANERPGILGVSAFEEAVGYGGAWDWGSAKSLASFTHPTDVDALEKQPQQQTLSQKGVRRHHAFGTHQGCHSFVCGAARVLQRREFCPLVAH